MNMIHGTFVVDDPTVAAADGGERPAAGVQDDTPDDETPGRAPVGLAAEVLLLEQETVDGAAVYQLLGKPAPTGSPAAARTLREDGWP